jgi:hypothetical protein
VPESQPGIKISRHPKSVYGSIEWALPTAVAVYITKEFFGNFFSESGK